MENTNNKFSEDISNCPYHNSLQLSADKNNTDSTEEQNASNGDWDNERKTEQIDEDYDTDQNDNSGGAGSSGSASTNS